MSKNKSKPGVCGLCGTARVRPCENMITPNIHGCFSGHTYELGELVKVRCHKCEPPRRFEYDEGFCSTLSFETECSCDNCKKYRRTGLRNIGIA